MFADNLRRVVIDHAGHGASFSVIAEVHARCGNGQDRSGRSERLHHLESAINGPARQIDATRPRDTLPTKPLTVLGRKDVLMNVNPVRMVHDVEISVSVSESLFLVRTSAFSRAAAS